MALEYIQKVVPTLHGWCTVEKATHLYNLVLQHDKPVCVELGVFAARSFLPIAMAANNKNGSAVGIDAWAKEACEVGNNDIANTEWWNAIDYDFFYSYSQNVISEANVSNTTSFLRLTTSEAVKQFTPESISVLHQDSNHSDENTIEEVNLWHDKLKLGGHWIFDDTDWPTTKAAQALLLEKGYELIFTETDGRYKVFVRKS